MELVLSQCVKAGRQGRQAGHEGRREGERGAGRADTIHRNGFMSLLISALHPTEILKTAVDYFHREICRDALRSPNS